MTEARRLFEDRRHFLKDLFNHLYARTDSNIDSGLFCIMLDDVVIKYVDFFQLKSDGVISTIHLNF